MRRAKLNIDPDLGDLEEMLSHVQIQLEREIDANETQSVSLTNIRESPRLVRRTASFNRKENLDYSRSAQRPNLLRANSELPKGHQDFEGSDRGSLRSFQSDSSRHSSLSYQEPKHAPHKSRTMTLPRGYGSTKEKNWEEYWA